MTINENGLSRLPRPNILYLKQLDYYETETELCRYINFVDETLDGYTPSTPPHKHVEHWMRWQDWPGAVVVGCTSLPLMLGTGEIIAISGWHAETKTVFKIQPELLPYVPRKEECGSIAVEKAIRFLCDEWLCDVLTDTKGKCLLISFALSIIERLAVPSRPFFNITAGKAAGGKTTALSMVVIAVTGNYATPCSWSFNEEERRKALFAHLRAGTDVICWDNIPRGTKIKSAAIEMACTATEFNDRVLGESRSETAMAFTVQASTGNNIFPAGDLATRTVNIRINVERPDPENRVVKHADPLVWTENHRGEIMNALYTILLGNPQLGGKETRLEPRTRFKQWWNLVGSAVEYAACVYGQGVVLDFREVFAEAKADDEDEASNASILEALAAQWPSTWLRESQFDAAAVAKLCADEDCPDALKGFASGYGEKMASSKTAARRLSALADNPIQTEAGVIVLKMTEYDAGTKAARKYWVENTLKTPNVAA